MKFSGIFFGKGPCFIASDWLNINSLFPFQVSILSSLPDLLFFLVIYRGYEKKGSIKLAREYSGRFSLLLAARDFSPGATGETSLATRSKEKQLYSQTTIKLVFVKISNRTQIDTRKALLHSTRFRISTPGSYYTGASIQAWARFHWDHLHNWKQCVIK